MLIFLMTGRNAQITKNLLVATNSANSRFLYGSSLTLLHMMHTLSPILVLLLCSFPVNHSSFLIPWENMYICICHIQTRPMRISHPWSGDSQRQETFIAPYTDKQTRYCGTECSNHHPSQSQST